MSRLRPTPASVRALFARSGNTCAFPGCGASLVRHGTAMLAQVCHIRAAAPGGPRYDAGQSDEDRRALANLIALCPVHHLEVDAAPQVFTAPYLEELRGEHEEEVQSLLPRPERWLGPNDTSLNSDPRDFDLVRVSNATLHPGSADHWSLELSAQIGDIISVTLYYHVSGTRPARDVQLYLEHVGDVGLARHHFFGVLLGSNSSRVRGAASVMLSTPANLVYVMDSMAWYPDQAIDDPVGFPFRQDQRVLFQPDGVFLGDIAHGWTHQGSIVCQFESVADALDDATGRTLSEIYGSDG